MLDGTKLNTLASALHQTEKCVDRPGALSAYVRDNIEQGQKIYTFDGLGGIASLVYVGSYTNMQGGRSHVLTAEGAHYREQFIHHHFIRELLDGCTGEVAFPSEALYLCEKKARRELKKKIQKAAADQLAALDAAK